MFDLSFIIVNWNTSQLLINCIESIYTTVIGLRYQIYVVDNGSEDDSVRAVHERFPRVVVIENKENRGFAAAVNQALRENIATYSVLLNTDTILQKNAIHVLYSFLERHKDVGVAGAQLQKLDGTQQHSYDNYPTLALVFFNKSLLQWFFPSKYPSKKQTITQPIKVESVVGACFLIRNDALKHVGKLDEDYFFFLEETDWCYRMQKEGWKVCYVPEAKVIHLGGQSRKRAPWQSQIEYCRSLYLFFKKNRHAVSYILLRTLYFIRIWINLVINFIGNLFVLFLIRKLRYRLSLYARLLMWHLLLCPDWMGLKRINNKK